jgi:hypothetical protein
MPLSCHHRLAPAVELVGVLKSHAPTQTGSVTAIRRTVQPGELWHTTVFRGSWTQYRKDVNDMGVKSMTVSAGSLRRQRGRCIQRT